MKPVTVIIADSLTNDFASPLEEFLAVKAHIGLPEVHRVLGRGDEFGRGPLPAFLREAQKARVGGLAVHTVFVRDLHDPSDDLQQAELLRFGLHDIAGSQGAEFLPALADLVQDGHVIDTSTLSVPAGEFHRVMHGILGRDVLSLTPQERKLVTFVITGFHTEIRILSTALRLRNDYGFPGVFVCPHLVGSRDGQAHRSALQVHLPNALVSVVPGLPEMAEIAGLPAAAAYQAFGACRIEPAPVRERLDDDEKAVVENLFLFCTAVTLTPLSGGFSGSLLFLAQGEKQGARLSPLIVKVAHHREIHRELAGYGQVKEYLGLHAPAIGFPVSIGSRSGVAMTLAAMEGTARTLQKVFLHGEAGAFPALLDKALALLSEHLYENTLEARKVSPCREFALTGRRQQQWLTENIGHILPGQDLSAPTLQVADGLALPNCISAFASIAAHTDYLTGDFALSHGDLNLANLITDDTGALWVIDWAYSGERPLEFDFAKLENDIKHVLSREFTERDLPALALLEEALLREMDLPAAQDLQGELAFVGSDGRFARLWEAVRTVRARYCAIRRTSPPVFYRIAQLKYAVHTLSFDARRGRGECNPAQLSHALVAACLLAQAIEKSELLQSGRQDRHESYPARSPVPSALAPWEIPFPDYAPARAPSTPHAGETPDDDDWCAVPDLRRRVSVTGLIAFAPDGRPLNPAGRTGLEGRGFFLRWGPNRAVDPVVTRLSPATAEIELLLVKRHETGQWGLPGAFLREGESAEEGARRTIREKTGIALDGVEGHLFAETFMADERNTDNAWVETTALHFPLAGEDALARAAPGTARVADAHWVPVTPDMPKRLFAGHGALVRACLERMTERGDVHFKARLVEETLQLL